MVTHEPPSRRHRLIAGVLSTPALVMMFGGIAAEALGNPDIGDNPAFGVVVILLLVLVPWATAGLAFWTISWWANHGRVPLWLLLTMAGNALVTWYLNKVLRG